MPESNQSTKSLVQTMYQELRQVARNHLRRERPDHTLQATALVNEAFMRLKPDRIQEGWTSRSHFRRAASEAMRRILVDHARAKLTAKRGGDRERQPLADIPVELPLPPEDLLAIHESLDRFAEEDPVKAELVKLRVFAGMNQKAAAASLGLPKSTADRFWSYAKVRLVALMNSHS